MKYSGAFAPRDIATLEKIVNSGENEAFTESYVFMRYHLRGSSKPPCFKFTIRNRRLAVRIAHDVNNLVSDIWTTWMDKTVIFNHH